MNGQVTFSQTYGEGPMEVPVPLQNLIMHATFQCEFGSFMVSDAMERANYADPAESSNVHINLGFSEPTNMERIFHKLGLGGSIKMPLQKQFWSVQFGMLVDKYGFHWMFNCPLKEEA